MNIKTKLIETPKAKLLVVGGLPWNAGYFKLVSGSLFKYSYYLKKKKNDCDYALPRGLWHFLGKPHDITEEQAKQVVELIYDNGGEPDGFGIDKIYIGDENDPNTVGGVFDTAKEALISIIGANVKLRNKYGEKPKALEEFVRRSEDSNGLTYIDPYWKEQYKYYLKDYEAEQQTVFTNVLIFVEK